MGSINVARASISAGSLAPNEVFSLPDTMHSQAVLYEGCVDEGHPDK